MATASGDMIRTLGGIQFCVPNVALLPNGSKLFTRQRQRLALSYTVSGGGAWDRDARGEV